MSQQEGHHNFGTKDISIAHFFPAGHGRLLASASLEVRLQGVQLMGEEEHLGSFVGKAGRIINSTFISLFKTSVQTEKFNPCRKEVLYS